MAFIFAGSPDSLANQRLATDRTNIDLAQNNQRLQQQAIDTYNQQQIAAQRQAEEDARQNAAQEFQFANLAAQQQANQQSAQTQAFQFGQTEADKAATLKQSGTEFEATNKLNRDKLNQDQAYTDFATVMNGIASGDITDPEDISTHDKLTPQQKSAALTHLATMTAKRAQEYQGLSNVAAAATRLVKPLGTTGFKWFTPDKTEAQAMDEISTDPSLKRFVEKLQWDPDAQQFEPNLPKPKAAGPGTTAPPSNPLSAGGAAPSPAAQPTSQLTPDIMKGAQRVGSREEAMNKPAGTVSILPDGSVVRSKGIGTSDIMQVSPPIPRPAPPAPPTANPFAATPTAPLDTSKGTGSPFVNVQYMDQQLQKLMAQRQALLPQVQAYAASNPGASSGTGSIAGNLSYLDDQINKLLSNRARTLALIDPSIRNQLPPNPAPPAPFAPAVPWGQQFQFGTPGR